MLNEDEKRLLAVVKYFNDNRKNVAKLVKKLDENFEVATVTHMTGFDANVIDALVNSVPARKSRVKKEKVVDAVEVNEPADVTKAAEPIFPVHTIVGRLANELFDHIDKASFKPGDDFLSIREIIETFECTKATAERALNLLKEKNVLVSQGQRKPLKVV